LAAFDEDIVHGDDVIEVGDGPETRLTNARWSRPPLKSIDVQKDNIVFQQIDLDFYEGTFKPICLYISLFIIIHSSIN
jgi:hypothetical protein